MQSPRHPTRSTPQRPSLAAAEYATTTPRALHSTGRRRHECIAFIIYLYNNIIVDDYDDNVIYILYTCNGGVVVQIFWSLQRVEG